MHSAARILIPAAFGVAMLAAAVVASHAQAPPGGEAAALDATNKVIRALQTGALPTVSGLPSASTFGSSPLGDNLTKTLRAEGAPSPRDRRSARSGETASPKFTGGWEVPGFKAVVRIAFTRDNSPEEEVCTGFLLSEDSGNILQVLTAAHCSCGPLSSYQIFWDNVDKTDRRFFELASFPVRYADYTCLLPPEAQPGRDLALLWIRAIGSKDAASGVAPSMPLIASMHQLYEDKNTQRLVGVGYGRTESGKPSKVSVAAAIPIQSYFCADGFFAASTCASFREFVLADTSAGRGSNPPDSCGGDSGAPIFWVPALPTTGPPDLSGARFLVGITSRGLDGVRHLSGIRCGGGGLYTAVGHPDVVRWLSANGVLVRSKFRLQ